MMAGMTYSCAVQFWDQLFAVALADICIRLITSTIKARLCLCLGFSLTSCSACRGKSALLANAC